MVTNYNQLWTSAYDSYVDSLIESDSTTEYYTDKNNTKHLWLAAGVPLVEAKVTNKITVTCEMPKKGFVFCKWSLSGNSGAGGGTFMPPKQVKTKKAE